MSIAFNKPALNKSLIGTFAAAALLAGALAGTASGHGQQATAATNHIVSIRDDSYSRSSITIPRTDKVTWKWRGTSDRHGVKSPSSAPVPFHSAITSGTFSYSHKFNKTGTYKIFCPVHDFMKITVKVTRG
jgi:plastocyanin